MKNTNSNSKQSKKLSYEIPAYIRFFVGLLERIAPKVCSKWLLKIFYKPLVFKRPEREYKAYNTAQKEIIALEQNNGYYTLYQWGTEGPKVLFMHGWSGRATQFFMLIEALLNSGYHVFSIEAPGHGDDKQRNVNLFHFVECINITLQNYSGFEAAIGHSLGGMAIFNSMAQNQSFKKAVTIGTPSSISSVVHNFAFKVGASANMAKRIIAHIEEAYNIGVDKASTDYLASEINPDGLIIHDEDDKDVAIENANILHKAWPNAACLITKGRGHRKVLMDNEVISSVINFIALE